MTHCNTRKHRSTALVLAALLPAQAAHAQGSSVETVSAASAESAPSARAAARPLTLFAGAGSGYGWVGANARDYADNPSGLHLLVGASAAFQTLRWELEAGASWLFSDVRGANARASETAVRTRTGTLDLGARYRLGQHWQVGPVVNLTYGADMSLSPSVGPSDSTLLLGAKGLYEFGALPLPVRLWSQVSVGPAGEGRNLFVALAGLQLGIPVIGRPAQPKLSDVVRMAQAAPDRAEARTVRVSLDTQKVFFGSNSEALKPGVAEILAEVGAFLRESSCPGAGDGGLPPSNACKVTIAGHADQRGRFAYNLELSRKRAESVRRALFARAEGQPPLEIQAHSYLKPLDPRNTRAAWARNRRVELTFTDVENAPALREKLKILQTRLSN